MKKLILTMMLILLSIQLIYGQEYYDSAYTGPQMETILDYSNGVTPGTALANKALILDANGNIALVGVTANVKIPNNQYLTAVDFAGTGTYDILKLNEDDYVEFGRPQKIGAYILPVAAGVVTWVDMDTDGGSLGTEHGVAVMANAVDTLLSVITEDDGVGGIQNTRIDFHESNQYKQVVTVAKSGGNYNTIQAAINSISDATASKIYTVLVYPGEYDETIYLKNWVDVVAVDPAATKVLSMVGDNGIEVNSYIRITIEAADERGIYAGNVNSNIIFDGNASTSNVGSSGAHVYQGNLIVNGNVSATGTAGSGARGSGTGILIVNGDVFSDSGDAVRNSAGAQITINGNISAIGAGKYGVNHESDAGITTINGNISSALGSVVNISKTGVSIRNGTITCSYDNAAGHGISTTSLFTLQNVKIITTNVSANSIYAGTAKNVVCMGVWANADDHANITQLVPGGFTYDVDVE